MATTADYLTQLQADKQTLVDNLVAKGVEASNDETFTTLAPKVAEIQSGGASFEITDASYLFYKDTRLDIINELCACISKENKNCQYMFSECYTLTEVPQFDTSNVTNAQYMFYYCSKLTEVPQFDTSNVTSTQNMFGHCSKLTEVPQFDTSNVTNAQNMFSYCSTLTEVPQLNTSNFNGMSGLFDHCTSLTTVPELNAEKVTRVDATFGWCSKLTTVGGLLNLGKAYEASRGANYSNYTLTLSSATNLTHDSLMNVINKLYDIASIGVQTQKLTIGATNLAKLTDEEIAIATNKGWTVS